MVALMKDYVAYMGDEKCRTLTALINETFTFLDSQDQKRK